MSFRFRSLYLYFVSRFSFPASSGAYADTLMLLLFRVSSGALIYNLFWGSHLQPLLRLILKPLPGLFIPAFSGTLISSIFRGSHFQPLLGFSFLANSVANTKPLPWLFIQTSSGALVASHFWGSISCRSYG